MGILPWSFGNVVSFEPRSTTAAEASIVVRALANWGILVISILGSIASLLALFFPLPLIGKLSNLHYELAGAFLAIFTVLLYISIRDQYRRWRLYQRAVYYIHNLIHELRDRIDIDCIHALQREAYIIDQSEKNPLNQLLYETLNDICDVFRSLVYEGSISVNVLIPVSINSSDKPTHLMAGLWSRPYDSLTTERRAKDKDGNRFRARLDVENSTAGFVFRTKCSVLIRDVKGNLGPFPFDMTKDKTRGKGIFKYVRSAMYVPIVLEHQPLFVLSIDCSKPRQFHPDYVEIARMCADLLATLLKLGIYGQIPNDNQKLRGVGFSR
jgi:hypothetical protein